MYDNNTWHSLRVLVDIGVKNLELAVTNKAVYSL